MTDPLWLDIRNSAGHLLFRYNPFTNEIELRSKGVVYELIRLDELRSKYGVVEGSPEKPLGAVVIHDMRGGQT